jgi:hypothetical protein
MRSLQEKASEWSGVATAGAFAIDHSTNFYTRSIRPVVPLLHRDSIRFDFNGD